MLRMLAGLVLVFALSSFGQAGPVQRLLGTGKAQCSPGMNCSPQSMTADFPPVPQDAWTGRSMATYHSFGSVSSSSHTTSEGRIFQPFKSRPVRRLVFRVFHGGG